MTFSDAGSTPAASTNKSFIINVLLAHFDFVQQLSAVAVSPADFSHGFRFRRSQSSRTIGLFLAGIAGEKLSEWVFALPFWEQAHVGSCLTTNRELAVRWRKFSG